jgi:hypothetical protein
MKINQYKNKYNNQKNNIKSSLADEIFILMNKNIPN